MKKLIISLILILAGVYACLAVLGSGGEYAAEKLFYRALKNASKITMNPDVAPPAQLAAIENDLKMLIKKYPGTAPARIAHISLMEFYISNKKYSEAIDMSEVINRAYKGDLVILSTTQFLRGSIYEKQGKWGRALEEFNALKEKYPNTQLGIQIPLYIGKYYESKGSDKEADAAYRQAAAFYLKIEKRHPGTTLGYTASVLLIQTHLNLKDYESAGNVLETTFHNYPSPISLRQLLPLVERIYVKELNSPGKAVEIYKYILSKTKNPRLEKFLNARIKKIESKK